jgi:hypothetical protein
MEKHGYLVEKSVLIFRLFFVSKGFSISVRQCYLLMHIRVGHKDYCRHLILTSKE